METRTQNSAFKTAKSKENYLITGATGTVGRLIVSELLHRGKCVKALSRNPEKATFPDGVVAIKGDLNDPGSLKDAFRGITGMHLITISGESFEPLESAEALVEIAEKAGVKRCTVLWSGFMGPVENAVRNSSMEWTLLCPQEFMKNTLEWAESIRTKGEVHEGFGDRLTAMIHEGDIARVAATALVEEGHAGRTYTLTGPETLKLSDTVGIIGETIGKEIKWVPLTEEQIKERMRQQGIEEEALEFVVSWYKNTPPEGYTVVPTVEEVTGQPAHTFRQWAKEHRDNFETAK